MFVAVDVRSEIDGHATDLIAARCEFSQEEIEARITSEQADEEQRDRRAIRPPGQATEAQGRQPPLRGWGARKGVSLHRHG